MKIKLTAIIVLLIFTSLLIYYINYQQRDTVVVSQLVNEYETQLDPVRVMTYNIQHGVGNDGILDLDRIISIIENADTHIIGLNEVDYKMLRSGFADQIAIMARELNMSYIFGPTLKTVIGSYGNAILTVLPVLNVKNHPLPVNFGREPRGLLEADLLLPESKPLKVLITHLSLNDEERLQQLDWINNYLQTLETPFVLMGDFNKETACFDNLPYLLTSEKTYPSDKPALEIDMFLTNCYVSKRSYTIKTNGSDHLPLIIELPLSYNKV